jgi:hypothetical protein
LGTPLNLTGFKLTYDDEFNSFTLSPNGSKVYQTTTFYFGGRPPSNGEQEFYSDSSVGVNPFSLQNGALDITAQPGGEGHLGAHHHGGLVLADLRLFRDPRRAAAGPGHVARLLAAADRQVVTAGDRRARGLRRPQCPRQLAGTRAD